MKEKKRKDMTRPLLQAQEGCRRVQGPLEANKEAVGFYLVDGVQFEGMSRMTY